MTDHKEELIYWIWLTKLKGIGPVMQRRLLDKYKNPVQIFECAANDGVNINGIRTDIFDKLDAYDELENAKRVYERCHRNNIELITIGSSYYPLLARNVAEMPILLYYKGILKESLWGDAIVGARRCSREAKDQTLALAKRLGDEDIIVISGMAKGIDSYAHTECILNRTYTVAVLGNGIDICYPCEHKDLMDRIVETGLVISEYEPGILPSRYTFPKRNRIIAALSRKIYIPESGTKSGARITADYGQKYGREVIWGNEYHDSI